jgi:hypothetical protein
MDAPIVRFDAWSEVSGGQRDCIEVVNNHSAAFVSTDKIAQSSGTLGTAEVSFPMSQGAKRHVPKHQKPF